MTHIYWDENKYLGWLFITLIDSLGSPSLFLDIFWSIFAINKEKTTFLEKTLLKYLIEQRTFLSDCHEEIEKIQEKGPEDRIYFVYKGK